MKTGRRCSRRSALTRANHINSWRPLPNPRAVVAALIISPKPARAEETEAASTTLMYADVYEAAAVSVDCRFGGRQIETKNRAAVAAVATGGLGTPSWMSNDDGGWQRFFFVRQMSPHLLHATGKIMRHFSASARLVAGLFTVIKARVRESFRNASASCRSFLKLSFSAAVLCRGFWQSTVN
jgi:hypothetical protein